MQDVYEEQLAALRRASAEHERQLHSAIADLERAVPRPRDEFEDLLRSGGVALAVGAFALGLMLGMRRAR